MTAGFPADAYITEVIATWDFTIVDGQPRANMNSLSYTLSNGESQILSTITFSEIIAWT